MEARPTALVNSRSNNFLIHPGKSVDTLIALASERGLSESELSILLHNFAGDLTQTVLYVLKASDDLLERSGIRTPASAAAPADAA